MENSNNNQDIKSKAEQFAIECFKLGTAKGFDFSNFNQEKADELVKGHRIHTASLSKNFNVEQFKEEFFANL